MVTMQVSIMSAIRHPNVVLFMGLCLEPPCIVTEFCARGSLYDVLKKARSTPAFAQQLDWSRRLSMALDAAKVTCHALAACPDPRSLHWHALPSFSSLPILPSISSYPALISLGCSGRPCPTLAYAALFTLFLPCPVGDLFSPVW